MSLEVAWPRHKWDYLSVPDPDIPVDPPLLPSSWSDPERSVSTPLVGNDDSNVEFESRTMAPRSRSSQKRRSERHVDAGDRSRVAADVTAQQGRALAAQAFLHGAKCGDRRVGELLGVCRQTAGRDRTRPLVTTPPVLERAQALIAASADRGSTSEERAAAVAWLTAMPVSFDGAESNETTLREDIRSVVRTAGSSPLPMEVSRSAQCAVNAENGVTDAVLPSRLEVSSMHASLTRDQVDACGRLHRRIRIRADAIRRLLQPEAARDELIEVILDLLGEIRGATESLETLLQDTQPGHMPTR